MYKSFNAEEYRKHFSLPADYAVEGFLSYGSWDENEYKEIVKSILDENNISYTFKNLDGFLSHIFEIKINNKNYWFVIMYGGTMLSEYIHLASLFGSKKNIHIGSCGGLHPEIESLDLIIPTWSYGNESITRIYDKNAEDFKHFPDENLSKFLEQNIDKKYNVKKGPIITNQAMMGESFEDIESWSQDGYYGVEMEISTVFAVSKHFKVPSVALVFVSDNLIKNQTVGDESHLKQKEARDKVKHSILQTGLMTLIK